MGLGQDELCQDCPSGPDNGCCLHPARTMCNTAATDGNRALTSPFSPELLLIPWGGSLNNMVMVNLPVVVKYPVSMKW